VVVAGNRMRSTEGDWTGRGKRKQTHTLNAINKTKHKSKNTTKRRRKKTSLILEEDPQTSPSSS